LLIVRDQASLLTILAEASVATDLGESAFWDIDSGRIARTKKRAIPSNSLVPGLPTSDNLSIGVPTLSCGIGMEVDSLRKRHCIFISQWSKAMASRLVVTVVCIAGVVMTSVARAANRRVDVSSSCTSDCDGTSWALAHPTLDEALLAASSGDRLWVAEGTYKPIADPQATQLATFQLVEGVELYGGFQNGEEEFENRNPSVNQTILSGNVHTGDLDCYHVVTGGVDGAVLEGFIIQEGRADGGDTTTAARGGGLFNVGGDMVVRNCVFTNNIGKRGGAIYTEDAVLQVRECQFNGNEQVQASSGPDGGGAVYVEGSSSNDDDAEFVNCVFNANTAYKEGGAVAIHGASPTFRRCTFDGNMAPQVESSNQRGGAVFVAAPHTGTSPAFIQCNFVDNEAALIGGAVSLRVIGSDAASYLTPSFVNCKFTSNRAKAGGAVHVWRANPTFTNCLLFGNEAYGVYDAPGIYWIGGAAMFVNEGVSTLQNCTIAGNEAVMDGSDGGLYGGIYILAGSPEVDNTILWGNTSEDSASTVDNQIKNGGGGTPVVSYSCVEGTWGGSGSNNTAADPKFYNLAVGNVFLSPFSSAANAGSNGLVPDDVHDLDEDTEVEEELPWDLVDGHARVLNTTVDMGAYESTSNCEPGYSPTCPWDMNGDGTVAPADRGFISTNLGCTVGIGNCICDASDLDGNGVVNDADRGQVSANYGPCP
jgi:predicted outer membrane repeat protein